MGDGAAYAFARETGMSFNDAYDCLYGDERMSGSASRRCPICGKKSSSPRGVLHHATEKHQKPAHAARIEAWRVQAIGDCE
jgi:hypothetical protein